MDVITHLVVRALNHLSKGETWATERLRAHAGAQIFIDGGLHAIRLAIDEHGLFLAGSAALSPDVTITLPADIALRLLFERDKLFSSVKLGGSADIAESFAFVLRNLNWDAEGDLASVVGDIAAHRIALIGRSVASGARESIKRATENVVEYVAEESATLTTPAHITEFGQAINHLRDDVARLEKRISRL